MGAIANGGTLYYLQYPQSQEEARNLVPRIKRKLDIGALIPVIKLGMRGAGGIRDGASCAGRWRYRRQDRNLQRESYSPRMVRLLQ